MKTRPLLWKGRKAALWRFPVFFLAYAVIFALSRDASGFLVAWIAFGVGSLTGGFAITEVEYAPRKWIWMRQASIRKDKTPQRRNPHH